MSQEKPVVHVYSISEEDRHSLDLARICPCEPTVEGHSSEAKPYFLVIHNEMGPRLVA